MFGNRNAIILSAGTSSRFVPLSYERPKGLLEVKGEILIERQIRQLLEAGIRDITIVVGYKAEMFKYLEGKYGVTLVLNGDFNRYNNISSLIRVLDKLGDTYVCSSDNYFPGNVFLEQPLQSYYSALYADGKTSEYCLQLDSKDNIIGVSVGGSDSWYMIGHVFFNTAFSEKFKLLLSREYYDNMNTRFGYWEDVYRSHIEILPPLTIHRYQAGEIEEFDSLDELRAFDASYIDDSRSILIKKIAKELECSESQLSRFKNISNDNQELIFAFHKDDVEYQYNNRLNLITQV